MEVGVGLELGLHVQYRVGEAPRQEDVNVQIPHHPTGDDGVMDHLLK